MEHNENVQTTESTLESIKLMCSAEETLNSISRLVRPAFFELSHLTHLKDLFL